MIWIQAIYKYAARTIRLIFLSLYIMITFTFCFTLSLLPIPWIRQYLQMLLAHILLLPSRIRGVHTSCENFPKKPSIVMPHHGTFVETIYLYTKLFPAPLIKRSVLFMPILGAICVHSPRNIWVKRTISGIPGILKKVKTKKNCHLLIFPEAQRQSFHAPISCKSLAYLIAKQTEAPIIPMVHNTHFSYRPSSIIAESSKTITFKFLEPFVHDLSHGRTWLQELSHVINHAKNQLPGDRMDAISVQTLYHYLENRIFHMCVIDIRLQSELAKASLPFATPVEPDQVLNFCLKYMDKQPKALFAIICHHGVRSAKVTHDLRSEGVVACNVLGGIHAWSQKIDHTIPQY